MNSNFAVQQDHQPMELTLEPSKPSLPSRGLAQVKTPLAAAAQTARELIIYAQSARETLLLDAKHEAEKLFASAKLEGYEAGRLAAITTLVEREALQIEALWNTRNRLYGVVKQVCEEVLATALVTQPSAIAQRIERAIRFAALAERIQIIANPIDIPEIENWLKTANLTPAISIKISATLPPGEAVLKTSAGSVRASPQSHLEVVLARLPSLLAEILEEQRCANNISTSASPDDSALEAGR